MKPKPKLFSSDGTAFFNKQSEDDHDSLGYELMKLFAKVAITENREDHAG